ncbi:rifin, partial [Plasmodium reichenowi]
VHNQRNHKSITPHTPKIPTTRLLCECELYAPDNYDNDPQMKYVMENFHKQTQQRFHEYDDGMIEKRKQCKDLCDKEIQKIILKDKLEKQMAQQLDTLETKITTDDIPTCVCEKSLADKVEKGCLRCGGILGAAMPELGAIGGGLLYALNTWKPAAIIAAKEAAEKVGALAGKAAGEAKGVEIVNMILRGLGVEYLCPDLFQSIGNKIPFNDVKTIAEIILQRKNDMCSAGATSQANKTMCETFHFKFGLNDALGRPQGAPPGTAIPQRVGDAVGKLLYHKEGDAVGKATISAEAEASQVTVSETLAIETAQEKAIESTFMANQTAIIASIVAIVVIVLIMIIIYLILRYRRKKKMKKKLQYIKLLEK